MFNYFVEVWKDEKALFVDDDVESVCNQCECVNSSILAV